MPDLIVVAILAKDKAHCLPFYLKCLKAQSYPKDRLALWIRSNNNRDNSSTILEDWIAHNSHKYHSIFSDFSNLPYPLEDYSQHEWNKDRFKILVEIRIASVKYARKIGAHYFVADVDNFIRPHVLQTLYETGIGAIAPMLRRETSNQSYANFHYLTDDYGYFKDFPLYYDVLFRNITGIITVDVIHCTYLLRREILKKVAYEDGSERHEYVIFSDFLRKAGIKQYLDNRYDNGCLSFAETLSEIEMEPWWSVRNIRFRKGAGMVG